MEERSTIPFCHIEHRDGFPDDKHLSAESKNSLCQRNNSALRWNHQPKTEKKNQKNIAHAGKGRSNCCICKQQSVGNFTILKIKHQFPKVQFLCKYNNVYFCALVQFIFLKNTIEASFSSYRTASKETSITTYFSLCSDAFGYIILSSGKVSSYSNLLVFPWHGIKQPRDESSKRDSSFPVSG